MIRESPEIVQTPRTNADEDRGHENRDERTKKKKKTKKAYLESVGRSLSCSGISTRYTSFLIRSPPSSNWEGRRSELKPCRRWKDRSSTVGLIKVPRVINALIMCNLLNAVAAAEQVQINIGCSGEVRYSGWTEKNRIKTKHDHRRQSPDFVIVYTE